MEEEHFGGLMEVGMKASSEMECRVDMGHFSEKEDTNSMKDHGTMECSMGKESNFSKMDRSMMVLSNKTNSMEMVCFTKTIR